MARPLPKLSDFQALMRRTALLTEGMGRMGALQARITGIAAVEEATKKPEPPGKLAAAGWTDYIIEPAESETFARLQGLPRDVRIRYRWEEELVGDVKRGRAGLFLNLDAPTISKTLPYWTEADLTEAQDVARRVTGWGFGGDPRTIQATAARQAAGRSDAQGMWGALEGQLQSGLTIHQGYTLLFPWVTAGDDRVCEDCQDLADNGPYLATDYPEPPHFGCRCNDPFPDPVLPDELKPGNPIGETESERLGRIAQQAMEELGLQQTHIEDRLVQNWLIENFNPKMELGGLFNKETGKFMKIYNGQGSSIKEMNSETVRQAVMDGATSMFHNHPPPKGWGNFAFRSFSDGDIGVQLESGMKKAYLMDWEGNLYTLTLKKSMQDLILSRGEGGMGSITNQMHNYFRSEYNKMAYKAATDTVTWAKNKGWTWQPAWGSVNRDLTVLDSQTAFPDIYRKAGFPDMDTEHFKAMVTKAAEYMDYNSDIVVRKTAENYGMEYGVQYSEQYFKGWSILEKNPLYQIRNKWPDAGSSSLAKLEPEYDPLAELMAALGLGEKRILLKPVNINKPSGAAPVRESEREAFIKWLEYEAESGYGD